MLESEVRLVIAGTKNFRHDEALSTLQTLKIVEGSCQSVELCSRREYARWLVLASNILARKPSERILPAMYIEGESSLAFDDIVPEDPDYPYIQGIAEAGLIESKLGFNDSNGMGDPVAYKTGKNKAATFFLPDSCIKRQDVLSWKVALEYPFWWKFAEKVAESKLAYTDTGSIHTAARFAVLLDLSAGEKSIAASAFGYTRRFQPEHPVTKGQAAVAIVTGQMAVAVSEEELHVQNSMNEVIMKELVLEAHAKKELDVEFKQVLAASRESRIMIEKMAEATIDQANIVRAERWSERLLFERERSAIKSEKQLLSSIREGLIGKSERLSVDETNLQIERSRCERLKIDAETRKQALLQATSIIEAEMRAIKSTRMWTEDEAKRSIAQAGILVQSKKRWGIKTSHSCHLEP